MGQWKKNEHPNNPFNSPCPQNSIDTFCLWSIYQNTHLTINYFILLSYILTMLSKYYYPGRAWMTDYISHPMTLYSAIVTWLFLNMCFLLPSWLLLSQFVNVLASSIGFESLTKRSTSCIKANSVLQCKFHGAYF